MDLPGGSKVEVMVFGSQGALEGYIISRWAEISRQAISMRGVFRVALSGGSSPEPLFKKLAGDAALDWYHTQIFQVDERFVPRESRESNFRMIRRSLLDRIHFQPSNLFPIPVPPAETDPRRAARNYEMTIREEMDLPEGSFPRFDLVLLGLGKDGHTASLFPGDQLLMESARIASPAFHAGGPDRVTLTLPSINNARNIFFFVIGKEKSEAFRRVAERDESLPGSLVRPVDGELVLAADIDAGGDLTRSGAASPAFE